MYGTIMTGVAVLLAGTTVQALRRLKQTSDKAKRKEELAKYMYDNYVEASAEAVYWKSSRHDPKIKVLSQRVELDKRNDSELTEAVLRSTEQTLANEVLRYIRWSSHTEGNKLVFTAELLLAEKGGVEHADDIQRHRI